MTEALPTPTSTRSQPSAPGDATALELPPTLSANEADRLQALRRYNILDTPPETAFDRITTLAARLFDMPTALVSLVDESRAWFKSCYGFDLQEVPRGDTVCSLALLYSDVLVIPDARLDTRLTCNPFVQSEPGLRFYAGAPLLTQDGFNLGTLCLLDMKPHADLTVEQKANLADLAAMVVDELELRLAALRITQLDAALLEVTEGVSGVTGEAFFYALVQHFTKVLQVDYAYIGLIQEDNPDAIATIAACAHDQIIDNFTYRLQDTPCQEVIRQRKLCCYPRGVQACFPQAPLLQPLNVESYVAIPVFDSAGTALGLLGVMGSRPLENVHLAEALLPIFALRIATELERQRTEENRLQLLRREQAARQQAEAANRIKDEFLAVLSHELRSPLNPILGWVKLLQSRTLDGPKTTQALNVIEHNAKLQAQLIEDLLDVSRILQGKLSLSMTPVSLAPTIRAALETVRLAAEAKSIGLEIQFHAPEVQVLGDATRLQQVIWNLLTNAIKFNAPGGKVSIQLTQIDGQAQIQVIDTGKGIQPDFLPYVFDTFRQADATTTRKFGGLGLGLAIVRHLVELHGGTVQADSAGENQGATFTVNLPLLKPLGRSDPHQEKPVFNPQSSSPLAGVRVLLVDDEADSRDLVTFILEQAGAIATPVASVAAALEALQQVKPDILVSDIAMPERDGYGLIQHLRAMPPEQGGQMPAIALTAYAGEIDQQQALTAGFQMHLAKPLEPDLLVQAIATLTRPH